MKKLFYLFIAATILISCSSDEDTDFDLIIGKWQQESILLNGMEQTTDCEKKSTITFLANGTTNTISFYEDGNGCISETDNSTWVNVGNSTYKVGDGVDDEEVKLNFTKNNTAFSATTSETFDGETFTIVITFKKI